MPFFVIALFSCNREVNSSGRSNNRLIERKQTPEEIERIEIEKAENKQKIENAKIDFLKLKPHFNITKDEFDGNVTYRHKLSGKYTNSNGTTLKCIAETREIGVFLFGYSVYVGNDWIFYDKFTIKIGDELLTETGTENRDATYTGVIEVLNLNFGKAQKVFRFIADNPSKEVRVRLSGDRQRDYTLPKTHQIAIRETVEIFDTLKILSDANVNPSTIVLPNSREPRGTTAKSGPPQRHTPNAPIVEAPRRAVTAPVAISKEIPNSIFIPPKLVGKHARARLEIDENGRVTTCTILDDYISDEEKSIANSIAMSWKFKPGLGLDGKLVPSSILHFIQFNN